MIKTLLTVLIPCCFALSSATAQTFELKPKKIKLTSKNAEVFPELELRVQSAISTITKEPKYKSSDPQKFVTTFGGEDGLEVIFAGDEKKGSGKGFDSLFADIDGTGNLAKGKRLSAKPVRISTSSEDTTFPPLKLEIPAGEEAKGTKYEVQARLTVSRPTLPERTPKDSTLYLTSLYALEGEVMFGEAKQKMVVFDANCNGVFGEKGSIGSSGRREQADTIWVGSKTPSLEDAYVGSLPLGKYLIHEGKYYELGISEDHQATITPAEVTLGKVKVSSPGFLLELREGKDVLYISNTEGQELDMPVGNYTVTTPGFRRKGKGGIWELQGDPGSINESFEITEGGTTEVEVGPPLKLVLANSMSRQGTGYVVSLKFSLEGQNGEVYKYLRQNGKRVKLPEVSIRNEKGKEVKKGHFEYG